MYKRKNDHDGSISPKKPKYEENPPSRVIHIRGLPSDVSEHEVASVAIPFGPIHYMVVTKKTGQALIEMENTEVAETMYSYFQENEPFIRNKKCFLQYSIHNSLQAPNSHMHPDADNAVSQANQACDMMNKENGGKVLRFIVEDWNRERITSLHLYKVYSHYGNLEKIVIYINKGIMQGFVQFTDSFSARVAKAMTNGFRIFPNSCTMRVYFSNRETLDIGKEDEMVRDFNKHPVTSDEMRNIHINVGGRMPKNSDMPFDRLSSRHSRDPFEALVALQPMLNRAAHNPEDAMPLLRSLAPAIRGFLDSSSRDRCHDNRYGDKVSPLLIVSNLDETKVTPDALFILFGHYGDVSRVKIMYNRKNTALVQFMYEDHAERALKYLNGVNFFGKPLHINFSKHDRINNKAPVPGSEEDNSNEILHKDYSDSKLHRFRKRSSKSYSIYEPGRVLHVAGLVEDVTEEDIEELFQNNKFNVKKIRVFEVNRNKMALVELGSTDEAIEGLIKYHDYELGGSHLRVSFSKGHLN